MQVTPSKGDRVDVPKRDFTREVSKREGGEITSNVMTES